MPETFHADDYGILVVAEKYQTGFDEPLLHTMFVDKKLSGVKAVQTLSRLNRTTRGKVDTFVLDFVNSAEDIKASFEPFYEETVLLEETDPNVVYDMKNTLDDFRVYQKSEVDKFADIFYQNENQSAGDLGKLQGQLRPAIDRYEVLEVEKQDIFKSTLASFNRVYAYITQVCRLFDKDIHRFSIYSKFLYTMLPKGHGGEKINIDDKVLLEYYKLEKDFEGPIELESTEGGYTPISGDSGHREPKKDPLTVIIDKINEKYGTHFTEMDKVLVQMENDYAKHWIEDIVWEMNTDEEDTTSEVRSSSKDKRNKGFIAHIDKLRSYLDAPEEIHLGRKPEDLLETLVNMVLGSPAICIYRSNGRSTARATSLAKVFVNNFNLPESTAIIDLAYGRCRDDNSHWQNVLKYCKDGCFQAMIDEYIHMLKETAGFQSDGNQYQIVHDMMMDSLKIHTATYIADTYPDFKKRINGADRKSDGCRIRSSYAVGFTKDAGDNSKVVMRKENIRNAFNSPMRPFVLATTSIGQEGLDFHNYCRVIMHWNLPSNPIDVGRILRTFKIKKNVEVTDNGKIII